MTTTLIFIACILLLAVIILSLSLYESWTNEKFYRDAYHEIDKACRNEIKMNKELIGMLEKVMKTRGKVNAEQLED